jgi:uncharacterized repeat protein (TIGR02543 family)
LILDGKDCTPVTAVADQGYVFTGWSGDYSGTDNPLTITNVTADMYITANFSAVDGDGVSSGGGGCFVSTAAYSPMRQDR